VAEEGGNFEKATAIWPIQPFLATIQAGKEKHSFGLPWDPSFAQGAF
jgi:hypothetical protein